MPAIDRVIGYIDGFNFYNGLMSKGWGRYRWLNWHAVLLRYMRNDQQLVGVKYFTSRMTHQPDKLARQDDYLRVMELAGDIEVIPGKWDKRRVTCPDCGNRFKIPQEKFTDVAIASHLVADAAQGLYDTAILCTGDSDLVPAVETVRARFGRFVILMDPPQRHSDDLIEAADIHVHTRANYLTQSQFPNPFTYTTKRGNVRTIECPSMWQTNEPAPRATEPDDDGISYCSTCQQPIPVNPTTPTHLNAEPPPDQ